MSLPRLLACVLPLAAAGCLPIPWTKTVSPPMTGVYRRVDGTPAPGMHLVVSTADEDVACARPLLQTTTDSAGMFQLPKGRERQKWFPLQADLAWSWFTLCAGPADSLRAAFHGSGWEETRMECFEWAWRGRTHTTCGTPDQGEVLWGGRWSEGATTGSYRVITLREGSPPPFARVVVQWLASPGPGVPTTVRATAELPCSRDICRVDRVVGALSSGSPTILRVFAYNDTGGRTRNLFFELGPPGQYREVERR